MSAPIHAAGPNNAGNRGRYSGLTIVLITLLAVTMVAAILLAVLSGSLGQQLSSVSSRLHSSQEKVAEAANAREVCVEELNNVIDAYNAMSSAADYYAKSGGEVPNNLTQAILDAGSGNTAHAQALTARDKAGEAC